MKILRREEVATLPPEFVGTLVEELVDRHRLRSPRLQRSIERRLTRSDKRERLTFK